MHDMLRSSETSPRGSSHAWLESLESTQICLLQYALGTKALCKAEGKNSKIPFIRRIAFCTDEEESSTVMLDSSWTIAIAVIQ